MTEGKDSVGQMYKGKKAVVVGAGPAGLEAARALGQRGYPVTLAEAPKGPTKQAAGLAGSGSAEPWT